MKVVAWPGFSGLANPYCSLLYTAMQKAGVDVIEFRGRKSLVEAADILHMHWPDVSLKSRSWIRAFREGGYCLYALYHARRNGTRVVWTAHNLQSHENFHPILESIFWWLLILQVDGVISLSAAGASQVRKKRLGSKNIPVGCIPHGHYRGCYPSTVSREEARRFFGISTAAFVVGWIGQIRPYKGLPELVEAWKKCAGGEKTLLVGGESSDPALQRMLETRSAEDPTIQFRHGRVKDEELQYYFTASDVIVAPYRKILNSGTAILALSFDRPVALPRNEIMLELQNLVGKDWVYLYEGEFNETTLAQIIAWSQQRSPSAKADLAALEWDVLAGQTLTFFQRVISESKSTKKT